MKKPVGPFLTLCFSTLRGQTYQVEYKANLTDSSWIPLDEPAPGSGNVLEVDDDSSADGHRFYRLVVLP